MKWATVPVVLALLAALAGCGEEDDPENESGFTSDRVAPPVGEGAGVAGSETDPDPEESVLELELDSGATVVLWVDPDDYRKVYEQHSHEVGSDAWTEPELLYEAGDGCQESKATRMGRRRDPGVLRVRPRSSSRPRTRGRPS